MKLQSTIVAVGLACCTTISLAADWTPGPSLNVARGFHGVCTSPCGDIYAVGGVDADIFDSVEILKFDSVTGYAEAWLEVAPMTTARYAHTVACVNGFIYAIGGIDDLGVLASVERYDTTAKAPTWDAGYMPDLNVARYFPGSTIDKWGRIWVVGGYAAGKPLTSLSSVEIYDPARPEFGWAPGPELNIARAIAGVVTDRLGRIYAIGGATDTAHIVSVERFDPCNPEEGWVVLTEDIPGKASQQDYSVLGADGRIYVAGGWLPGYANRLVRFDPDTETWEPWTALPEGRGVLGLTLGKDGRIYLIGGELAGFNSTETVLALTPPCGAGGATPLLMDSNSGGEINTSDLLELFANWGLCPE
ncbi:MAG: hypothetical protein IH984_15685 [Planctomycetes bacterium]|nr:hypothetical protein [Planctomycetota bacterium]